jgi:hypothetical protein
MAGVAGLLVVGTLSSSATTSTSAEPGGLPAAENPAAYVPAELPGVNAGAPAAGGEIKTSCKGKACTITFPAEGGSVDVLGTTVTATKFYSDGITLTVAGTPLTSNLTTPAKGAGYTTQTTKVDAGAQSPHTVKITKN